MMKLLAIVLPLCICASASGRDYYEQKRELDFKRYQAQLDRDQQERLTYVRSRYLAGSIVASALIVTVGLTIGFRRGRREADASLS